MCSDPEDESQSCESRGGRGGKEATKPITPPVQPSSACTGSNKSIVCKAPEEPSVLDLPLIPTYRDKSLKQKFPIYMNLMNGHGLHKSRLNI